MALNCEDIIRQALNRSMTEEEVLDMASEARRLARQARAGRKGANQNKSIRDLTGKYVRGKQSEIEGRKRALEFQKARRIEVTNYALDNFQGMEWEGLQALMSGSKYVRAGARASVDSMRGGLTGRYVGGLLTDIEALGKNHWRMLRKGKLDKEICEAMWTIDNASAPQYKGPPEAMDIAKVIHKWQEIARVDENNVGSWIAKLPGYVMRQSHDADKIRQAGYEAWRNDIGNVLDWTETAAGKFDGATPEQKEQFLKIVYDNLVTGVRERTGGISDPLMQASAIGSVAAKVSQHRVLHFQTGTDFYNYNKKYGRGLVLEGVIGGLTKSANDTALMRLFGPSPQANLDNMINHLKLVYKSRGDVDSIKKINKQTAKLNNIMKELDGTVNMGGNPTWASVGRFARAVQSMAKLGGAMISGFSDVPLMSQEFHYQGASFFKSMTKGLQLFVQGRGTLEQRRILSACGVFFDSMAGSLVSRFSGQELPGRMTYLMNLFFKANGLSFWTDAWRKSATLMMSHDLANLTGKTWSELNGRRRRVLSLYNIDEDLWELMRSKKMRADDGRNYFTPDVAEQLSNKELARYMKKKGMLLSKERVLAFREDIANRLRSYFKDRVQYAVLEPDARTNSIIRQGQAAGTLTGELLRFTMQFKSFPAVFLQRTLGREVYGYGSDKAWRGLAQSLIPKNREITGMVGMLLMTTLFGYMAMTTKELLAGKKPRPLDSMEDFGKVFLASFIQGGGAGIYGDFLFGAKSRMGDDFLSTLAGPTMGTASNLNKIYKSWRDGEDIESTSFRTAWGLLPGNNLYWLRPVTEHLFLQSMYEYMNPGYNRRMRKRIKEENNQTFYMQPTVWNWAKHRHKVKNKKK